MQRKSFLHLLAGATLAAGCGGKPKPGQPGAPVNPNKPRVAVATTTMLADLVRKVGGERFVTVGLMGPGVDPHLYKPTTGDINNLNRCRIVFYNGLMLEGRMGELFASMAGRGRPMVEIAQVVAEAERLKSDDGGGHPDPHIWGNVEYWIRGLELARAKLAEIDPDGAALYQANADAARAEWTELHAWAKARAAEVPRERRVLVTSHDAFAYLGEAYGFEVVGVQGISTAAEAGLADISRTVDYIRRRGIPAIFVESSVPHGTIERISQDSGARIGGELFSDACGMPGQLETRHGVTYDLGTYAGMMRHNLNAIVDALK